MKRSEMLGYLSDYFTGEGNCRETSDIEAFRVLNLIEQLGMLPPEKFRTPIKNQSCEWESENET